MYYARYQGNKEKILLVLLQWQEMVIYHLLEYLVIYFIVENKKMKQIRTRKGF